MFDTAVQQPVKAEDRGALRGRFAAMRRQSEALAADLSPEDQSIQSMPDCSPTKWHLAHTTWFFETFLLQPLDRAYRAFDPAFAYLFNSYYEAAGPRHPRPERGLLSRPSVAAVGAYREHVTAAMLRLIDRASEAVWREAAPLVELGIHHEQQHQELILMDIKHVFSINPLLPAYQAHPHPNLPPLAGEGILAAAPPLRGEGTTVISLPRKRGSAGVGAVGEQAGWVDFAGGLVEIGHAGNGFAFDNEGPRHKVWLDPFRLATHPVSCGEFLDFIADGGYRHAEFWLSDGWATVRQQGWEAPAYWRCTDGEWRVFTLSGEKPVAPAEPVCHVSLYEADAFARWAGRRLPTEAEWEIAAADIACDGHLADRGLYHPSSDDAEFPALPSPASGGGSGSGLRQMIGDVWEWTASPYVAYPRFRPVSGAIGEYNGKFMSSQMVLRGGAAVTPADHMRITYRNFFPPAARWAFSGLRLAEDA